jgi:hypothetical protein
VNWLNVILSGYWFIAAYIFVGVSIHYYESGRPTITGNEKFSKEYKKVSNRISIKAGFSAVTAWIIIKMISN